jgi:hypothetical protein
VIGANNDKVTTVKDMSNAYIEQISVYQMQIDEFWQNTVTDPHQIIFVNERMHQLFKKLSSKMTDFEQKRQFAYESKLQETRSGMFTTKKHVSPIDNNIVPIRSLNQEKYCKYKFLLEKRELELNSILERAGLTAVSREQKKRLH